VRLDDRCHMGLVLVCRITGPSLCQPELIAAPQHAIIPRHPISFAAFDTRPPELDMSASGRRGAIGVLQGGKERRWLRFTSAH
jgi:hypothetical protein